MSFEAGSVSFRVLAPVKQGCTGQDGVVDHDVLLEYAAANGLADIDSIRAEKLCGWVGPRHLLDGDLSSENCCPAQGMLRLSLAVAQRRYPAGRLKAEVMREQMVWMKAEGRAYCPRKVRAELKAGVIERLLPDAPVGLDGIELISCTEPLYPFLITDALSDAKSDALVMALSNAGQRVRAIGPDLVCEGAGINPRDLKPLPFAGGHGEQQAEMFSFTLGREFLMWLLWSAETVQEIDLPNIGRVAVFVDGPLVMKKDDGRVETLRLQGEAPTVSGEFCQAMAEGMLLKRARVTLAAGEVLYTFDVDADDWTFRGVKLPMPDDETGYMPQDVFLHRLNHLYKLWTWWTAAFGLFIAFRTKVPEEFHKKCFDWAFERPVRCRMPGLSKAAGGKELFKVEKDAAGC